MSSFFTLPTSQRKRKREAPSTTRTSVPRKQPKTTSRKPQKQQEEEDEVVSDAESISSGSSSAAGSAASSDASSDHADETAAERRLRLAEQYLSNIRDEVGADRPVGEYEFDAADVDRELIAARLKEDVAEEKGRLHRFIASRLELGSAKSHNFKADTLAMTAVAMCGNYVYTASKDMRLIKWEIPQSASAPSTTGIGASIHGSKQNRPPRTKPKLLWCTRGNHQESKNISYNHHTAPILCLAASHDGAFLASGGADRKLIIWDASTLKPIKVFTQHRDAVTSLAFRGKTGQLFSGSKDRTVKIWSCTGSGEGAQVTYVDTLFGHQDEVVDVAAVGGTQERCVSVGARDRTARLWKVVEESQLVFRGGGAPPGSHSKLTSKTARNIHRPGERTGTGDQQAEETPKTPTFNETSLDRVTQIDTQLFVTGSDSGALSLYSLHKKKALHVYPLAHGFDPPPADFESSADVAAPALALNSSLDANSIVANGGGQHKHLDSEEHSADSGIEVDAALIQAEHKLPPSHRAPFSNTSNAPPTSRWITALKAIPYTDLFVSGSWDGFVRLWRVGQEVAQTGQRDDGEDDGMNGDAVMGGSGRKGRGKAGDGTKDVKESGGQAGQGGQGKWRIFPVGVLGVLNTATGEADQLKGIINDLAVSALGPRGVDGVRIVAALGKEMRLGRWKSITRQKGIGGLGDERDGAKGTDEKRRGHGNGAIIWEIPLRRV